MNRKKICYREIKSYLPAKDEEPNESNESEAYESLPDLESSSTEMNGSNPKTFRVKFVVVGDRNDIKLNIKQKIKTRIRQNRKQKPKQTIKPETQYECEPHYRHEMSKEEMEKIESMIW
jgi:hypothetical protein